MQGRRAFREDVNARKTCREDLYECSPFTVYTSDISEHNISTRIQCILSVSEHNLQFTMSLPI